VFSSDYIYVSGMSLMQRRVETMANTYRRQSRHWCRKPKGFKSAKINGARPKAVPPTDWDDNAHSEGDKVVRVIRRMLGRFDHKAIIDRVTAKTGTPRAVVAETLEWVAALYA
jgi:hypothetical protein